MACEESIYSQQRKQNNKNKGFPGWVYILISLMMCVAFTFVHPELYRDMFWGNGKEGNNGNDVFYDDSIYAHMEGVNCSAYTKYLYDSRGLLTEAVVYTQRDAAPRNWTAHSDHIWKFDSQGRITLYELHAPYYPSETLIYQKIYEYSDDGYTMTEKWPDNTNEDTYTYDAEGRLIESYQCRRFRYPMQYTYNYDRQGRLISTMTTFPVYDHRYIYDENGEVQSIQEYYQRMATTRDEIQWDDQDFTSTEVHYDSKGKLEGVWVDTYNEDWQKTSSFWSDGEEIPEGETGYLFYCCQGYWARYRDGLLVEEFTHEKSRDYGNTTLNYCVYDYDQNGNKTMELTVYINGSLTLDRLVYDSQGLPKEEFRYEHISVQNWEQELSDGSMIRIERNEKLNDIVSITSIGANGDVENIFVFDDKGRIDTQYVRELVPLQEFFVCGETDSGLMEVSWKKTFWEVATQ